jgi:inner membrane protein|tara:strand:- start:116 stop:388 length:273 start_codon:yes stop_codon:yes gene_type:complete
MGWAQLWWVWIGAALVLLALEMLAPVYILLGFAVGALAVGLALLAGLQAGLPWLLLICAAVSLLAWVALRRGTGLRKGQTRIVTRDINED